MKLKSTRYFLSMLTVIYVFTACSQPVPPEKRNYVGEWKSKEMYLLILADGSVKYKRLKRGVSAEITGPIKEFQGDNFVVGIAFITTTFEVSKPPFQHNGVWYMVVDGVALRKINSPFICNDEVKIQPDDIARSIFSGQVYPSGNIYLRTFDETVKDSGLCIRISMYQTPGCAGHLARYYILDILRGNALLKNYECVKYEGSI